MHLYHTKCVLILGLDDHFVYIIRYFSLSLLLISAEVADACAFLASDDSRYITGVSIEVAGKKLDLLLNSIFSRKNMYDFISKYAVVNFSFLFNQYRWTLHRLKTMLKVSKLFSNTVPFSMRNFPCINLT